MENRRNTIVATVVGLILLLTSAASALAGDYDVPRWTVDNGGGRSSGGPYKLDGTVGQTDAAILRSGKYTLSGGFWGGSVPEGSVYLPNIQR